MKINCPKCNKKWIQKKPACVERYRHRQYWLFGKWIITYTVAFHLFCEHCNIVADPVKEMMESEFIKSK